MHTWRSEDNLKELDPWEQTRVTHLGGRHLYPLCHLTGPPSHTFVPLVHLVQGTTLTLLGWQRCLCCESFLQGEEVAEPRHPGWVALCLATSRSMNQLFLQLGLSQSPGEVRWFPSPLPLSVCVLRPARYTA